MHVMESVYFLTIVCRGNTEERSLSFCRIVAIISPDMRALLAACAILLLPACANQYLDEAEALDSYRDSAPELLNNSPGASDSDGGLDVSGLYLSEITSDHRWYFSPPDRNLLLRITQRGNRITAFDSTYQVKIDGVVEKNRVRFYAHPSPQSGHNAVSGTWAVDADGNLIGSWRATNHGAGTSESSTTAE